VNRIVLEVAVTTADEARLAAEAGADRLELSSALEVGGVSPSPGSFVAVREAVSIPIEVLIRPRPGGFHYTESEFAIICRDTAWFLERGADGIVCGCLSADGRIDAARSRRLVDMSQGKAVFHRAFDFQPDRLAALEEVIDLGFERILTSGGAVSAIAGREEVARLIAAAKDRIEILPAGSIRPENVTQLIRETGCRQVHASLRAIDRGGSTGLAAQMGPLRPTDPRLVRGMRGILDRLAEG